MANQTNPAKPAEKQQVSFWYRYKIGRILLYAILSFGAIVALTPFVYMLLGSLLTRGEMLNRKIWPRDPIAGLNNYVQAWNEANFNEYFVNSIQITTITIIGMLIVCVLAAYAFSRIKFPGREAIFGIFLATMMIPETILLIPNFLIVNQLNKWMAPLGLPWLNNWPSLTIPFMASVFAIFLMRQFFAQIPEELWDAARIDGAGHVRFMIQVVCPSPRQCSSPSSSSSSSVRGTRWCGLWSSPASPTGGPLLWACTASSPRPGPSCN
jgi:ABC-type glycerol-3-phosphate transport system permease component